MSKIIIYGVPGVGKTFVLKQLAKRLGYPLVEADRLKKKARKNKSRREFPFLYLGTCRAYSHFGELNAENAIKGLLAVREALCKIVVSEVEKFEDLIIEGAFLDPNVLHEFGKCTLIVTRDKSKHQKQFYRHLDKWFGRSSDEFEAARMVQEYLIKEAVKLGIEIQENHL